MFPKPPGRLIDVGGYRLHAQIAGQGAPVVVMDSGLTGNSIAYAAVLPRVARFTRGCAFDRAGYPWSDPAPAHLPRTSVQIVAEMRAMLQNAGLEKPYVLVGASFGGINILTYALRHPDEVAGLVFADSSHPEMFERVPGVPSPGQTRQGLRLFATLARWGLTKWLAPLLARGVAHGWSNLPPEAYAAQKLLFERPEYFEIAAREAEAGVENFAGARAPRGALGDLPLVVLTGAAQWVDGRPTPMKKAMLALREEMRALSSRGQHVVVEKSGHAITVDQPGAVVNAIRQVVDAVRQTQPYK
jgi:pimeloyl-ACP methyl ester carboxylesterase